MSAAERGHAAAAVKLARRKAAGAAEAERKTQGKMPLVTTHRNPPQPGRLPEFRAEAPAADSGETRDRSMPHVSPRSAEEDPVQFV